MSFEIGFIRHWALAVVGNMMELVLHEAWDAGCPAEPIYVQLLNRELRRTVVILPSRNNFRNDLFNF